jgi:RNA polymerase sigma factor (sigma-70 family)
MSEVEATFVSALEEDRRRFLTLVADVRPDLHRYCARMTGSVSDGEDIVQETLARAYYLLPEMHSMPPLRTWLFQIAHHRSLDHLRRYDHRMGESLDAESDATPADVIDAGEALARREAVQAAITQFVKLPPAQRSCVILKDVLGHSVEEIAALLELTVPAVKAALHRGRVRLQAQGAQREEPVTRPSTSPAIARYAALFNARDWDGVRAMLAEDVRLDLVSRSRRSGQRDVSGYLSNYDKVEDWHFVPGWLGGREVIAVFRHVGDARPGYFIELGLDNGQVSSIRDFRYVPYITADAVLEVAGSP